jgi:isopentenyldiphosphate isomerase
MLQEELVDIVDENENFLEIILKREAHEKGLLHKCVIANVIDSQGRWLLTRPSQNR